MPLSDLKKDKLKKLELERGGVAFATAKSSPTPTPTVVISLGGLGAQTLNALKGKFSKDIVDCDHIWFRMIDTDETTFGDFCKVKADGTPNDSPDAHMESGETIPLYDGNLSNCLAPAFIPAYIDRWLNPSLRGREIRNNGAQQTRQIGRVMVVHDTIYNRICGKLAILNQAVTAAVGGTVDVILIAGVSGGTGSGSVIDVAYMIHDLMRRYACTNYNLAGYIFTPDVQFTVPAIAASETIKANLQRNGYAALKEIDYFMNLEETGSTYRLQLMNGSVECTKNIFSSCTLVSGYNESGGLRSTADIISCLTDQLMDMLTDIKVTENGLTHQMSDSIMSNDHAFIGTWFTQHPERRLYHRYASYKYQVLGYNSIRIPRDEIFAYCVDKIYEGVLKEFKNFRNVNRQMMGKAYEAAHILNPGTVASFAEQIWHVERTLNLDGYNKAMVRSNPLAAYDDACDVAKQEAAKINGSMMTKLENEIYNSLKTQIDLIFDEYGPYVAMRAIQHLKSCLTDGDPNEPFSGAYEQLIRLSAVMTEKETACRNSGDMQSIREKADTATRFLGNPQDMIAYVSECCSQAVERHLNPVFFNALSKVLISVASRMNDYNSELFSVYTTIMDEVQYILSKDGDYFSKGKRTTAGRTELYSVDLIQSGADKAERLKKYLDDFISQVSVHDLSQNFIKSMRENKEKWLAQQEENNFDVAREVQNLMDNCLTDNNMIPQIIEKFVVVAYHPKDLTPAELDAIWLDDSPAGKKMQALKAAAHYILQTLEEGARAMAHSAGVIPLNVYGSHYFVSALEDTPMLRIILDELVFAKHQTHIAVSNSRNKFIYTGQYYGLPMYILKGMSEYNEQYIKNVSAGRHMDEKGQDWSRFQNPYTIDSVALDLKNSGKHPREIDAYPDKIILDEIKKQTKYGLETGYVKAEQVPAGGARLTLFDITTSPSDMERFNKELYAEAIDKYANEQIVDLIPFMEAHGFILNPILVSAGDTDVDLGLMDFENASAQDKDTKYKDVPVPVEDVYKWLRKSIKFMDILEKDCKLFEEFEKVLQKAKDDVENLYKYRKDIDTFALALKTGLVKRMNSDQNMWEYMDKNDPVIVDLRLRNRFDRKFFLYHVFVEFQKMSKESIDEIKQQGTDRFKKNRTVDPGELQFIKDHINEMLKDNCLGDRFNLREINAIARQESEEKNYQITDEKANIGNPFLVLRRFYDRIISFMD